ncbi:hypothetical protein M011DRAFT_469297 [Sporormia fimetaria CBS 119925]|uniref:Ankyrin repeat protein nuc-2 n=1 Tax=Sporormia fimetaria CBS 119925 TaxID=1340428 RepID=A0A6A6V570_9PLEO|nr:hypothetical protein M011DRAFT_469297 [Sporormia fimetaria CBS 119925]
MKFGKHIQKQQLEISEYADGFVDYKALKKLIKRLIASPSLAPQSAGSLRPLGPQTDARNALQANKDTFFFHVERELDKVNNFYAQKEAELRNRLSSLLEMKRVLQQHPQSLSQLSSQYAALDEGLRHVIAGLDKLWQFVEVNGTAFTKIIKKWDKASKSRVKQLDLSRAYEARTSFRRGVIEDLSNQATQALFEFHDWVEGNKKPHAPVENGLEIAVGPADLNQELEDRIIQAIETSNTQEMENCLSRMSQIEDARARISRAFLSTVEKAPETALQTLINTRLVNLHQGDEMNRRNCLHKAAICGRREVLKLGLEGNVDAHTADVFGRVPLHYACMHGHVGLAEELIDAAPDTINAPDHDNFTPLIHAIRHSRLACVQVLLACGAHISPLGPSKHIPLNLACQYSSLEVVELLLQRDAELLPDGQGLYPQHLVARFGKVPEMLLLLRKYGADLDQADKLDQWTPLFHAASEGHVSCVQTLLNCQVNVDIVDEKGLSAMYYAAWEGHWECMKLLESVGHGVGLVGRSPRISLATSLTAPDALNQPGDAGGIPDFALPPPILPSRSLGHMYLDTKTLVIISFEQLGEEAVRFYNESKYPGVARLNIASDSYQFIPRSIRLPVEDDGSISFQVDSLDTFAIDFSVYTSSGSRKIARGVASSRVFTLNGQSSGRCTLELQDPQLRTAAGLTFDFLVIKPFRGDRLDLRYFPTYWREMSDLGPQSRGFIAKTSVQGQYLRLYVQLTGDGIPVLLPEWTVGTTLPGTGSRPVNVAPGVNTLSYEQIVAILGGQHSLLEALQARNLPMLPYVQPDDIAQTHAPLNRCGISLRDALALLPTDVKVELHILRPNKSEVEQLRLGSVPDMNDYVDAILSVVFAHARELRGKGFLDYDSTATRFVFSSTDQQICAAINWKQPNYPVFLCNSQDPSLLADGETMLSIRDAVRIARDNNLVGLMCSARLLDRVPALVHSIKSAGLLLVSDASRIEGDTEGGRMDGRIPKDVDGHEENGMLDFRRVSL